MAAENTVRLLRQREGLETLELGPVRIALLAAGDGMEIIRHELLPGARWGLYPDPEWEALETVIVVSGRLAWYLPEGRRMLRPGDSIVAHPLREELAFEAMTQVHLLYACSQPVFHLYRAQAQEMSGLAAVAASAEARAGHGEDHCDRVQALAVRIGERLGLEPAALAVLNRGAFLHDLGMARVPEAILAKAGPLSGHEWETLKLHTAWGGQMLANTALAPAAAILEQHHERWDGSGYPEGRRGEAIALEAQIVAVADSYSAMTTDRAYRRAVPPGQAGEEITGQRGMLYHPDVVDAFTWVQDQA